MAPQTPGDRSGLEKGIPQQGLDSRAELMADTEAGGGGQGDSRAQGLPAKTPELPQKRRSGVTGHQNDDSQGPGRVQGVGAGGQVGL